MTLIYLALLILLLDKPIQKWRRGLAWRRKSKILPEMGGTALYPKQEIDLHPTTNKSNSLQDYPVEYLL